MANNPIRIREFLKHNLGHCPTCMRQALLMTFIAWIVFALASHWGLQGFPLGLIGFASVALTALWLLHVWVFAAREMAPVATGAGDNLVGRRNFLGFMLKAAGAGVVASVPLVLWPSAAHAFCGQCSKNADCGVGWSCSNTAGPKPTNLHGVRAVAGLNSEAEDGAPGKLSEPSTAQHSTAQHFSITSSRRVLQRTIADQRVRFVLRSTAKILHPLLNRQSI